MDAANVLVVEVMDIWESIPDAKWMSLKTFEEKIAYKESKVSSKASVKRLKISCQKFLDRLEEEENEKESG
ncbi:MAG: hypothetical protein OCD76_07225 [Reichenbachiella sp.]